ncbi:MAG: restriction endonuclease [Patescibacteria group bacterium]
MAKRYRRQRDSFEDILLDLLRPFIVILVFVLGGWILTHQEQAKLYGIIAIIVVIAVVILYFVLKRRRDVSFGFDDEEVLYMLKGMSPQQDVIAHKDGKKYYIQCKKFMTREVTPHDVRDFLGAITNVNNPAEKGFFVTTGNFTLMAEKAAEGNPRIELIDGVKLVEYYKLAYEKTIPETESIQRPEPPQN